MIKKILKVFATSLVIGMLIANTYIIVKFASLTREMFNEIQQQIDDLYESDNNQINNDVTLTGQIQDATRNIDKALTEETKKVNEAVNEVKIVTANLVEPDFNKLLKGNVFVRGFMGQGAGTIIKKTNDHMYILTCNHVVDDIVAINKAGFKMAATIGYSKQDKADSIQGMIVYGAEIIKYDEENDLALLRTSMVDNELVEIQLANAEPNKGDAVYSIGNPLGLLRTISKGILCNKLDGFYYSDNTTTYGNSGGSLFNREGKLIGVPSNVLGYAVAKRLQFKIINDENKMIPETSLGLSINLTRIKEFLKGVNLE
jgi:S1-C subfamily serine protease